VTALVCFLALRPSATSALPPPAPAIFVPPLFDAEPGEELRLRRGNEDWIWRIVSATDTELQVDYRIVRAGEPAGPVKPMTWPRNNLGLPEGFVVFDMRRDRIEAAGRTWECWLVRAKAEEGVRCYWITEELPVHGVIRIAREERGRPVQATQADVVLEALERPR
jgi:hypothetical protein